MPLCLAGTCPNVTPTGSCCAPAGTCTVTTQANCPADSTWTSGGICTPNLCPPQQPTGSCCATNGTCTVTTQANCIGAWTNGGTCTPNPCRQPTPTGSCCAADGTCTVTTQANCAAGSTWTAGGTCAPNPCQQPTGRNDGLVGGEDNPNADGFRALAKGETILLTAPIPVGAVKDSCAVTWTANGDGVVESQPPISAAYTPALNDTLLTVVVSCADQTVTLKQDVRVSE